MTVQLRAHFSAAGDMAIVLFEKDGEIKPLVLRGLDEIEQGAQLLGLHTREPVKIALTDARQQPFHHPLPRQGLLESPREGQVPGADLALVRGGRFCHACSFRLLPG